MRGKGRTVTIKAQVADEVAAAAPLAKSLPPAGKAMTGPAEDTAAVPSFPSSAGKGQKDSRSTGNAEGSDAVPGLPSKGSRRQKDVSDKAAEGKAQLEGVAKLANELQPTGSTLSTMQVHTKV